MGFATKTTGHVEHVRKACDRRTIKDGYLLGTYFNVVQYAETETEEWRGLSLADAQSLFANTEDADGKGYLGSVRIEVGKAAARAWIVVPGCRGTAVRTEIARVGDTDLFDVFRSTTVYTVDVLGVPAGSVTYC